MPPAELSPDQRFRQLLFAGLETQIELLIELVDGISDLGLAAQQLLVIVLKPVQALLASGQLVFHLPNRLAKQHIRLLQAVEHGVEVRREQTRYAGY